MKIFLVFVALLPCQIASGQLLSVQPTVNQQNLSVGEQLELSLFVTDTRPDSPGILSVFLDLTYDASLLEIIPTSLSFGPNFGALAKQDLSQSGVINETGAFVNGVLSLPPIPSGIGGERELLYSVSFSAIAPGRAEFVTNLADNLPLNATTLLGVDTGLTEQQIDYGSANVWIVPEPSTHLLALVAMLLLLGYRLRSVSTR